MLLPFAGFSRFWLFPAVADRIISHVSLLAGLCLRTHSLRLSESAPTGQESHRRRPRLTPWGSVSHRRFHVPIVDDAVRAEAYPHVRCRCAKVKVVGYLHDRYHVSTRKAAQSPASRAPRCITTLGSSAASFVRLKLTAAAAWRRGDCDRYLLTDPKKIHWRCAERDCIVRTRYEKYSMSRSKRNTKNAERQRSAMVVHDYGRSEIGRRT